MAALLARIDFDRTRLARVGDHNQLPPVGPGNVLRDLIAHRLVPTVVLETVERQAGILKTNSTAVLTGVVSPTAVSDPAWTVVDAFQDALPIQTYLRDLVLKMLPQRLGLDPVRDIQIITPTHLGALGTKALNQMMQHLLHGDPGRKFAVGDKVIQTANDYELGVMNGTQGRVLAYEPGAEAATGSRSTAWASGAFRGRTCTACSSRTP
jgi:exodeoxyribonuclease V alpha subunit